MVKPSPRAHSSAQLTVRLAKVVLGVIELLPVLENFQLGLGQRVVEMTKWIRLFTITRSQVLEERLEK